MWFVRWPRGTCDFLVLASALLLSACATPGTPLNASEAVSQLLQKTVEISAGPFESGSSDQQRARGYQLDETAYGHSVTRDQGWYEREMAPTRQRVAAFSIMRTPVTNAQYARFVAQTGYPQPDVDEATWDKYGFVHPYKSTRRFAWVGGQPNPDRGNHPVVLVTHEDARAYARWLSGETGIAWRLPTEHEWEKAARGIDGRVFPWGNRFDAKRLNSHDAGPFDTTAVGSYPRGASPYGVLDMAGQVYEWTADVVARRAVVKGGSWDDKGCGVCRPAARHLRPVLVKHVLIGFRLVHP